MKILLLEDDFEYRSSVSEYLQELGYEVDECSSGARPAIRSPRMPTIC